MKHCELLISAGWVVTVNPENEVADKASVIINDGRIEAILPTAEALATYSSQRHVERPNHILMPGLVNSHTHLAMNLLRGFADDLPLMVWLNKHIWPAEQAAVSADFVARGTRLALAESIQGGVTCVNDMYFYPDQVASEIDQAGMRGMVGMLVLDFPSAWAKDASMYFQRGLELHDQLRHHSRIRTCFAPHAPYSVAQQHLEKIAMLSTELDVAVHMHVHETADEVGDFTRQHGIRPLAYLNQIGLLNPSLMAVHMTHLLDSEIELVATQGVNIIHCPESNMKLASGAAPIGKLLANNCNVALGTDGAASNNDVDLLGETRSAGMLAKLTSGDAGVCPAPTLIKMATLNGARALGLDQQLGSLEVGKAADIIAINTDAPHMQPMHDVCSQIVYAASRHDVSDVWVNAQQLLENSRLTQLDADQISQDARDWQREFAKS